MTTSRWLGIDLGTSSIKGVVLDETGQVLVREKAPIEVLEHPDGGASHDPSTYRTALETVIRAMTRAVGQVDGIGLCGHTPSLVIVDDAFEPVSEVVLWRDQRATEEAAELDAEFGDSGSLVGTHLPWVSANLPAKLLWLSRNRRDQLAAGRWLLQPKDLAAAWLTGTPSTDPWSSKGLCNVSDSSLSGWLFDYVDVDSEMLPDRHAAWTQQGETRGDVASSLGLNPGTPVATGWSDALAAMLAAGVFRSESGFVLSGSSDIVGISTRQVIGTTEPLFHVPESCAPLHLVYGPTQTSGLAREWVVDVLNEANLQEDAIGPETPVFLPYLAGERAPIWNSDIRGAILGLSLATGRSEILAAVMAGVACSDRHVLESALATAESEPETVHLMDSAPDDRWARVRATVLGRVVERRVEPMASAYGAAMLGASLERGLTWAIDNLSPASVELKPDGGGDELFDRYLRASRLVEEIS